MVDMALANITIIKATMMSVSGMLDRQLADCITAEVNAKKGRLATTKLSIPTDDYKVSQKTTVKKKEIRGKDPHFYKGLKSSTVRVEKEKDNSDLQTFTDNIMSQLNIKEDYKQ